LRSAGEERSTVFSRRGFPGRSDLMATTAPNPRAVTVTNRTVTWTRLRRITL